MFYETYRYALVLVDKTKELSKEKRRTDSLLYQMVPRQVAEKLKTHKGVDAEYFKSVTILFSDICGFSQITLTLEPMNIVKLLNALYEAIDELLEAQNVYKVETINDSYMVASGLYMYSSLIVLLVLTFDFFKAGPLRLKQLTDTLKIRILSQTRIFCL